jgi:hypothetical protein
MPLTIKGKTAGITDDERLDRLAALWAEATDQSIKVRELESRVQRQTEWLDAHKGDPRYNTRFDQYLLTKDELKRETIRLHDIAADANALTDRMTKALKAKAQESIHAWVGLGSIGVYAMTWALVPDRLWFESAEMHGQRLREMPCPF